MTRITDEARIGGINHLVMPPARLSKTAATDSESDGSHFVRDTESQERWGHLGLGTLCTEPGLGTLVTSAVC